MARAVVEHEWGLTPLGPLDRWTPAWRSAVELTLRYPGPALLAWGDEARLLPNERMLEFDASFPPERLFEPLGEVWPGQTAILAEIRRVRQNRGAASVRECRLEVRRRGTGLRIAADLDLVTVGGDAAGAGAVLVVFHETTDTRELLAQLSHLHRLHAATLDASTDWALEAAVGPSHALTLESMTEGFSLQLGYTAEDLVAGRLTPLLAEADLARLRLEVQRLLTAESVQGEVRLQAKDGRQRWYRYSAHPEMDATGRVARLVAVGRDVTDRKLAEEALRAREAQLAAIFSRAAVGLSVLSLEGRFLRVNDELCRMLGRSRSALLAGGIVQVTHPDDILPSLQAVNQLLSTRESVSLDKRYLRPDGVQVPANSALTLLVDPEGQPTGIIAVTVDLTARKRAEETVRAAAERDAFRLALADALRPLSHPQELTATAARMLAQHLRASRAFFADLAPGNDEATLTGRFDADGRDLPERLAGDPCRRLAGDDQTPGATVVETNVAGSPELPPATQAALAAAGVGAFVSVRQTRDASGGGILCVQHTTPRAWLPEELAIIQETADRTWRDVERARTAAALRESEERLRAIISQSAVGIGCVDLRGRLTFVNRRLGDMLGRDTTDLLGRSVHELLQPEETSQHSRLLDRALTKGEPFQVERRARRPDGSVLWSTITVSPLRDAGGGVVALVGIVVDITARVRAEEALREHERRLAQTLAGMNRLQALSTRLMQPGELPVLLREILAATGELTGTTRGCIQILDSTTGRLRLAAHQGLGERFLEQHAEEACPAALASAARQRERVVIENLARAPALAGTEELELLQEEQIRALQSTPLVSRSGRFLGALHNYFPQPWRPGEPESRYLDLLSRMAADVVERSQAEQALRASEERYRGLFDSIDEGFCVVEVAPGPAAGHHECRLVDANPAFERHTGLRGALGRSLREVVPAHESEWSPLYARVAQTGLPLRFQTSSLVAGHWHEVYAFRIGEPGAYQVAILFNDITDLRRTQDELEQRVKARTMELDRVNAALRAEVLERRRTEEARQELLRQLVSAQEEERRRISRELHDGVGQQLTALILGLKSLESDSPARSEPLLQRLHQIATEVGQEVHDMALKLRPTALDDLGLLRTLSNFVEEWSARADLEVDFHSTGWTGERLPSHIESTIYRIVQEAFTNIVKHARAHRVSLIIERRSDQAIVIIEDDGCGFEPEALAAARSAKRLGLLGMQERASLVDGELKLESTPGQGTTVFVRIPLPPGLAAPPS